MVPSSTAFALLGVVVAISKAAVKLNAIVMRFIEVILFQLSTFKGYADPRGCFLHFPKKGGQKKAALVPP
jgi:hypothetical protein